MAGENEITGSELTPEEKLLDAIFGRSLERKPQVQRSPEELAQLQDRLKARLVDILKTLTPRERTIIELRYGLGDGETYSPEEVGRQMGLTKECVRQVEAKAARKLQGAEAEGESQN